MMLNYIFQNLNYLTELIQNAVLLFALVLLYDISNFKINEHKHKTKIYVGIIVGFSAILIMMNPWRLDQGLFFDTRSVLLGVTGLFFGPITAGVSAGLAVIYRVYIGGIGVYAGVLTILSTTFIGLNWQHIRKILPKMKPVIEYYVFGLFLHFVTLLCFLIIPNPFGIILLMSIPFLGFFPFVTLALALSLKNQQNRHMYQEQLNKSQALLQASIDSAQDVEIYSLNHTFEYLSFNEYHLKMMKKRFGAFIEINHSFFSYVQNFEEQTKLKSYIENALSGETFTRVYTDSFDKTAFIEEIYHPIKNTQNEVIGVTIFAKDITERKQYEASILHLSYHDALTQLGNRRYYLQQLSFYNQKKFYPLTIIISDINGLKIMNDAFGHDVGDQLLKLISETYQTIFPQHVSIHRTGGDEFIILLPNTEKEEAEHHVQKIRNKLLNTQLNGMDISVSFGVQTQTGNSSIEHVVKTAEDEMYRNKLFEVTSHRNKSISTILSTLKEKNPREEMHSERVSKICLEIGKVLGMNTNELNQLKAISNLHDIGKIAIDDSILNKPGKLTDDEWNIIKRHPEIGYRILASTQEYSEIAEDILSHHERFDGKGYPRGLKAEDIPIRARIISIADAYDAMISDRSYRKAMTHEAAIEEIKKHKGTQFDPVITEVFLNIHHDRLHT